MYVAEYIPTKTKCVALKFKSNKLKDKDLACFCRIVLILSNCRNSFVIPLLGYTNTPPFIIITQHYPNGSLQDYIHKSSAHLTPTNKTLIALGIAKGMMDLHEQCIMHRDLKSANVFLDNNLYPKISNFHNARLLDFPEEPQQLSQNVGTANWMAPEMFGSTQYDLKVDVYSYGMLLWELLTEETPFGELDSIHIAIGILQDKQRPTFPEGVRSDFKEFVERCWDQNPKNRPSFKEIYQTMCSKKIYFDGTDEKAIQTFLEKIENGFDNERPLNGIYQDKELSPNVKTILTEPNHPQFDTVFKYLSKETSKSFFDTVSINFSKLNSENMSLLLSEIAKFLEHDPWCTSSYLNSGIPSKLPLNNASYSDSIYRIFICIAQEHPRQLSLAQVKSLIELSPTNSNFFHLFSEISLSTSRFTSLIPIASVFLDFSNSALNSKNSISYVRIIKHLLTHSTAFKSKYRTKSLVILNNATKSNKKSLVRAAYASLCNEAELPNDIDVETLCTQITTPGIRDEICHMLLKMREVPVNKELIDTLINKANVIIMSPYILCKIAQSENGSKYLLTNNSWFTSNMGPLGIFSIFLVLFSRKENRKELTQYPKLIPFLMKIIMVRKHTEMKAVATIIRRLYLTKQFVTKLCNEGFVERFINEALRSQNWDLLNSCLLMLDSLARVTYNDKFLLLFPSMKQILTAHPQTALIALSLLTVLSRFEQTHMEFIRYKVIHTLAEMKLPVMFEDYRKTIFKQLKKSNTIV
ncbi:TKL family protein kinase [Histomonas meleagridis]|uniref:TKL family protein kinase n=1 Tax=Histomonas meleagridis TaxID=135588 RepID=UPI00355A1308|nr:TKL family protein kinase [Histomonas meleagridis]KAH0804316.1 TKL family protein kinase [Histomonas meleagridis]